MALYGEKEVGIATSLYNSSQNCSVLNTMQLSSQVETNNSDYSDSLSLQKYEAGVWKRPLSVCQESLMQEQDIKHLLKSGELARVIPA